jgi:YbgC/YbaW family acyl-CoA thioester hydrolase
MTDGKAPRIRTELQVMFFDTDCGGVVHNIAYLRFIEIARTLLAEKLGLALTDMAKNKTYPVVVRTEIDYRRAAKLGDHLVVEGWLERLERVRFWCEFRIVRPADKTLIAKCRQALALIELPGSKLLRLPETWEKYRSELGSRSGGFPAADLPPRRSGERRSLSAREENVHLADDSKEAT